MNIRNPEGCFFTKESSINGGEGGSTSGNCPYGYFSTNQSQLLMHSRGGMELFDNTLCCPSSVSKFDASMAVSNLTTQRRVVALEDRSRDQWMHEATRGANVSTSRSAMGAGLNLFGMGVATEYERLR
jgi:hypothetical protein